MVGMLNKKVASIEIEASVLKTAIRKVSKFCQRNTSKSYPNRKDLLAGVNITSKNDTLTILGSDGRIVFSRFCQALPANSPEFSANIMTGELDIPNSGMVTIQNYPDFLMFRFNGEFRFERHIYKLSGSFSEYLLNFDIDFDHLSTVNGGELKKSVRKVKKNVTYSENPFIKLEANLENLTIAIEDKKGIEKDNTTVKAKVHGCDRVYLNSEIFSKIANSISSKNAAKIGFCKWSKHPSKNNSTQLHQQDPVKLFAVIVNDGMTYFLAPVI